MHPSLGRALQPRCSECGQELSRPGPCPRCALNALLPATPARDDHLEIEFGRYTLTRKIATGGMGVIYQAKDRHLKRTVALKMVRSAAFADEAERTRFTIETEAAASLDHPHIVPVYEVGVIDDQPFFTMKLISGQSLAARLRDRPAPSLKERITWLQQIGEAVQHAHACGVLHRDLKPSNVIIDASGRPWLTDFGLAKLVHQESGLTLSSDRLGTPHYMAPEVIRDTARAVSTASDVWALGVMLWECLYGELPFKAKDPLEVMRQIGAMDPHMSQSGVNRDLLALAHRCLEKDPKRRVRSAGEFAEELDRWLHGEPLLARPVTSGERLWRWMKRNPAWTSLAAVLTISCLTSVLFWQRAERAVDSLTLTNSELSQTLSHARAVSLASEARLHVHSAPTEALALAVQSVHMTTSLGWGSLPESEEALTEVLQRVGGIDVSPYGYRPNDVGDGFIDRWHTIGYPIAFSPDGRWAMVQDHHTTDGVMGAIIALTGDTTRMFHRWSLCETKVQHKAECWMHDSNQLVTVGPKGTVTLVTPNPRVSPTQAPTKPTVRIIGQLPHLGEIKSAYLQRTPQVGTLLCMGLAERSPDQRVYYQYHLKLSQNGDLKIHPLTEQGTPLQAPPRINDTESSPDGRWLILEDRGMLSLTRSSSSATGTLRGASLGPAPEWAHWAFSPDSQFLAFRRFGKDLYLIDLRSGLLEEAIQSTQLLAQHTGTIDCMAFSSDGKWLAMVGDGGEITVVSLDGRAERRLHPRDANRLYAVAFSPDGRWLAAGSRKGVVTLWPAADLDVGAKPLELHGLPTPALNLTFSPDSQFLIAHGPGSHFRAWPLLSVEAGRIPQTLPGEAANIADLAISPDERWVAVACAKEHPDGRSDRGLVKLLPLGGDCAERVLTHHNEAATGVAFCPHGRWLASTGVDGFVRIWDMATLTQSQADTDKTPLPKHTLDMTDTRLTYRRRVAFHPAGRLYATSGDGILFEWDLRADTPETTRREHALHSISYLLPDVTVSPDGTRLAVARHGWDLAGEGTTQDGNMVLLYDVSDPDILRPLTNLRAHFLDTTSLRFSADSRWLAAGAAGRGVLVWDLHAADIAESRRKAPVSAHLLGDVAFSPDGKWIGIAASDGHFHLWDWRSPRRPRTIVTGAAEAALSWIEDGRLIVGGKEGRVAIWETRLSHLQSMAEDLLGH